MDFQDSTSGALCLPPFAYYPGRSHIRHVWIYAGSNAWATALSRARSGLPVLVLPLGRSPDSYRWPVIGLDITVIGNDASTEVLERLASTLLRAGACLIAVVCGPRNSSLVIYRQRLGEVENVT